MLKHLSLTFIFTIFVISVCNSYDPEAEQAKRLETFRKTCKKYNDDLTYEYPGEESELY